MTDAADPDPYCADPPRDSRASPMDMTPTKPTVVCFCLECGKPIHDRCDNCLNDKPTGFGK